MIRLRVRAFGRPAPQGSHEVGANNHVMHSSSYLPAWRRQVALAALTAVRAAGYEPGSLPLFGPGTPVYLHELTLLVQDDQCCAAGTREPTGRPDVDKLLRATIDGLGDAHLFADDSQIVKIHELSKTRPEQGELPGAVIIISDEPLPPAGVAHEQGESMNENSNEYRLVLERVTGRDGEGFPTCVAVFEMTTSTEALSAAGLPAVAALLGAAPAPAAADSPVEPGEPEAEKPRRGRPRKAALEAPEAVAEATEPAPVRQEAPEPVTAAQEAAQPYVAPAPAARVNPFAQG